MGLRSLLGFERPLERETRLSLAAYEDCRWYRKETLRRFRATAVVDLIQQYPDVELLADINAKHILGVSVSSDVLLCGFFLDAEYPDIDFMPDDGSNCEREAAIAQFRRKLSLWPFSAERVPHMIVPDRISVPHPISDRCHRIDDEIATRGYIYETVPLDSVASLQIRKNGQLLGYTSPWQQTPLQSLTSKIDLEVLLDCSGGPKGVSDLTIDVGVLDNWNCERPFRTAHFKQVYMDRPRVSAEINSRERKSISDATKAFVAAVYPFANQKPSDLEACEEESIPIANEAGRDFTTPEELKHTI